eukprot:scaffold1696_cov258-Pinguiococcus_pyrenoidosus.AAC.43
MVVKGFGFGFHRSGVLPTGESLSDYAGVSATPRIVLLPTFSQGHSLENGAASVPGGCPDSSLTAPRGGRCPSRRFSPLQSPTSAALQLRQHRSTAQEPRPRFSCSFSSSSGRLKKPSTPGPERS